MARNKRPVLDEPVAESSDSEQQNNSDQESDSDATNLNNDVHEDETDNASDADVPNPKLTLPESGSDTDSDSDRTSNFTIKPIHSKQHSLKSNNGSSKDGKRAAEAEAELGLKELKKTKVEDDNVKKGSVIQRLFSEDDEIALLEGIIEFQAKKGIDAYSDIPRFHEFIKKSIHFDVTANQLKEKIKRLKSKYKALVKKSGEDPIISKSHDLKVFNLSKKLWGSTSGNNVAAEKAKKSVKTRDSDANDGGVGRGITLALASKGEEGVVAKKQKKVANDRGTKKKESGQGNGNNEGADSEGDVAEQDRIAVYEKGVTDEEFSLKYPLCAGELMELEGMNEKSMNFWIENLGLIGKSKLEEHEAKLVEIKLAELELFIRKRELINEKLRLLCDALKRSK